MSGGCDTGGGPTALVSPADSHAPGSPVLPCIEAAARPANRVVTRSPSGLLRRRRFLSRATVEVVLGVRVQPQLTGQGEQPREGGPVQGHRTLGGSRSEVAQSVRPVALLDQAPHDPRDGLQMVQHPSQGGGQVNPVAGSAGSEQPPHRPGGVRRRWGPKPAGTAAPTRWLGVRPSRWLARAAGRLHSPSSRNVAQLITRASVRVERRPARLRCGSPHANSCECCRVAVPPKGFRCRRTSGRRQSPPGPRRRSARARGARRRAG